MLIVILPLLAACERGGEGSVAESGAGPQVVIVGPPSGTRIPTGQVVEIHSTANDEAGLVQRIELHINGELIAEDTTPIAEGQASFSVVQRWVPIASGSVQVTVYAYNAQGQQSQPAAITLEAEGEPLLPPTTPTVTKATPEPTATVELSPTPEAGIVGQVNVQAGLNVRGEPSLTAARIGGVNLNDAVTAIARNEAGDWVRIRFGPDNQEGWVVAEFITWEGDVQSLPIGQ